jgi:hypothetical protein
LVNHPSNRDILTARTRSAVPLERAASAAVVRIRLSAEDTQTTSKGLLPSMASPLQQAVGTTSEAGTPAPNVSDDVTYARLLLRDWHGRQDMALPGFIGFSVDTPPFRAEREQIRAEQGEELRHSALGTLTPIG